MQLIRVEIEATYPRKLPENFRESLKEEITRHMKAYGCDVKACEFSHITEIEA